MLSSENILLQEIFLKMINFKFFLFDKSSLLSIRPDVKPDDDTGPSVGESDRKAIM